MKTEISGILKHIYGASLMLAVFIATCGCSDSQEFESALVVEGYIESGGYPVVCLMQTIDPLAEGNSMQDAIVRWGKVTLSDGDKTVILTGGPDKNFFPPYTYTTYDIMGEPGKEYILRADYLGMHVEAKTTIPAPVEIEDIVQIPEQQDKVRLEVQLISDGKSEEFYRVLTRVRDDNVRLLPGFMGTGTNNGESGLVTIPANRPKSSLDTCEYISSFIPGEQVEVALCSITRDAYEFWRDYDNAVAFGGSQFLSPSTPIRSNIQGGYGYFFGYGISRRYITIQ